jgi:hypothetical protein
MPSSGLDGYTVTMSWRKAMRVRGFIVVAGALALAGCTPDFATQNEAGVILRATTVSATAGGEGTGGAFLLSDVKDTTGSIFNDNVAITVENIAKNPTVSTNQTFSDVVLERFEVRYVRSDGRSVEGVDIPYRITGDLTVLVPVNSTASAAFIVVRHQAKAEPPLVNIKSGGGSQLLTCFAEMTLFGHTTSGKAVEVHASLQITFADFAGTT